MINNIIKNIFFAVLITLGFINNVDASQQPPRDLNSQAQCPVSNHQNYLDVPEVIYVQRMVGGNVFVEPQLVYVRQMVVSPVTNQLPSYAQLQIVTPQYPPSSVYYRHPSALQPPLGATFASAHQQSSFVPPPVIDRQSIPCPPTTYSGGAAANSSVSEKQSSTASFQQLLAAVRLNDFDRAKEIVNARVVDLTEVTGSWHEHPGKNIFHILASVRQWQEAAAVDFFNFLKDKVSPEMLSQDLNKPNNENMVPLLIAVLSNKFDLAKAMICVGADVKTKASGQGRNSGRSIFGVLACFQFGDESEAVNFMYWLKNNMPENLFYQLLNHQSDCGFSPLFSALCKKRFLLSVEMIRFRAGVNDFSDGKNIFMKMLDLFPDVNGDQKVLWDLIVATVYKNTNNFDQMWEQAIAYEISSLHRDLLRQKNICGFIYDLYRQQIAADDLLDAEMIKANTGPDDDTNDD